MYDNTSIQALIDRIGWLQPLPPTNIVLSSENEESQSGRFFNAFNPLVTVENVKASIHNKDSNDATLNSYLYQLKIDGVMDVLNKVYNLNVRAVRPVDNLITSLNYSPDYSSSIELNQQSFDEAIGYSVSIKTLELLLSSPRSNRNTVSNGFTIEQIYQYLEGSFTSEGRLVSQGLRAMYMESIGKLINVLFPVSYPDGAIINSDGTVTLPLKPTLIARKLW